MDIPSAVDDFTQRRLCPDGACTGIIGPDGRCTECGRLVEPANPKPSDAEKGPTTAPDDSADTSPDEPTLQTAQSNEQTHSTDESGGGEGDDFAERRLCPDGSCTGIIGPDGRCTECGRLAEE